MNKSRSVTAGHDKPAGPQPASKGTCYALILVTAVFWGLSFIFMNRMLEYMEPLQVIAGRWTLAAIIFLILMLAGKVRIDLHKKKVKYIFLCGLLEPGLYSVFETYGLKYTSASISSIFIATIPVMSLIVGVLFFRRKTNGTGILSIVLAFTGVVTCTVFSPAFSLDGDLRGYFFMVAAVVMGAVYGFFSAEAGEEYGAMEVTATMAFMGCVLFNIECLIAGYGLSTYRIIFTHPDVLGCTAFLGIFCSIICYAAFNRVMASMDVALANNMSGSLITVVGVAAGIFIAGDPGGLYTIIGLAVTLAGVWLSSRAERE